MARHYHIDIAAFAADADLKWVDNLLSHFDVPGVESARQGVARRISTDAIQTIALVRALSRDGGLSVERALAVALELSSASEDEVAAGEWISIRLERAAFERAVDRRIAEAVESVVPRRRGRPPTRRLDR